MQVVKLIRLKVVFVARVRRGWRDQQVYAHPHHDERRRVDEQRRPGAAKVKQVLNRVHAETRERLDVRVPVVERVHVLVEHTVVQESVCKVEVEISVQRHKHGPGSHL